MLPRVRITELLAEVHGWTWFCRALRPPQSHRRRFLRRLAAYPRQNALARALPRDRLSRTDPVHPRLDLRSGAKAPFHAGLNKDEARNALARALFFHRQGEIRDRIFENQRYRASGLNLTIAAITSGTPFISAAPSPSFASKAKRPTSDHSVGNTFSFNGDYV
jgi:hypothetical protein